MRLSLTSDQLHELEARGHDIVNTSPKCLWDAIEDMMIGVTTESLEMKPRRMILLKRRKLYTLHDLLKELDRFKSKMDASKYNFHEKKVHVMCLLTTLRRLSKPGQFS